MNDVEIMQKLCGDKGADLYPILLETAEQKLLTLTNRTKMVAGLNAARRDWAIIAYNRLGMEGESSRSQGGISSAFIEVPEDIKETIKLFRIARVSGYAHEKITTENVPTQEESAIQG